MCGILCIFSDSPHNCDVYKNFLPFEHLLKNRGPDYHNVILTSCNEHRLIFFASVLWLQGRHIIEQPLSSSKSAFIYNGDVFGGNEVTSEQRQINGDTTCFLNVLENSQNISFTLENINGPYAFVYLNKASGKLYFGRDKFGRRSLLMGKSHDSIILASVSKRSTTYSFIELPAIGTFCYNTQTKQYEIFPWCHQNRNFKTELTKIESFLNTHIKVIEYSKKLYYKGYQEPFESDLQNLMGLIGLNDALILTRLLDNPQWQHNINKLKSLLEKAVETRISTQPMFCKNCVIKNEQCNHSVTGILFSGGVDCAILALLAHKYTDKHRSLDLINVAFDKAESYQTPDRITGFQTLEELKQLCPERKWNFVQVNVTQAELQEERSNHIADLIFPLNTILDDSLGSALWFASRGKTMDYESPCRVLLVGMGADELFGGYTKHRLAFKRKGWFGLYSSLEEDWENLPYRNLARDDRVVSDHGRQLRTPYLDEDVVQYVKNLNSWEKTFPTESFKEGLGEKILLRSLAFHLGLQKAAVLKKKALQFGSKIANSKERAHDISQRLLL